MGVEAASIPAPAPSLNRSLLQPTCNPPTSLHRYDQPSISLNNKPSLIKPPAIKRPGITTQTQTQTQTQTNAMNMIMNANSASDQKILTDNNNNNNNNIPKNLINTSPPSPLPVKSTSALERIKKSKSFKEGEASLTYSSSLILEAPGSIAAVRREQMALQNAQRKMRIAHYGRSKSAKFDSKVFPLSLVDTTATPTTTTSSDDHHHQEENKRCSFITPNTDPVYVAYHDEEWGVPVHDDNMLFELLVLSGAQVGSDWTSILKKRQDFRGAFSGFDAETVSNFTEKQMMSISTHYNIDISRIRGVVDNSNRILEVKKEFGSLNKYIWGFVNHKAISTNYKFGHKMAVKTSKSESISKDMVRRGFRFVGPTVVHSFMQAAGLTNDHLITCHRHLPCTLLAARRPINCQRIQDSSI